MEIPRSLLRIPETRWLTLNKLAGGVYNIVRLKVPSGRKCLDDEGKGRKSRTKLDYINDVFSLLEIRKRGGEESRFCSLSLGIRESLLYEHSHRGIFKARDRQWGCKEGRALFWCSPRTDLAQPPCNIATENFLGVDWGLRASQIFDLVSACSLTYCLQIPYATENAVVKCYWRAFTSSESSDSKLLIFPIKHVHPCFRD